MKKAIVLLLILTLIPTAVFADGEVFLENAESYSDTLTPITITIADNTSKQLGTTDWWMIKGTSGNPLNAGSVGSSIIYPTLSVVKNGDNTVFNITGGSGDYSSYISRRQAARYMGAGLANVNNAYKLEVDFEKVQTRATVCFQFMIHNNGKNYYIVNIAGEKSGGSPVFTVAKIADNALSEEVIAHSLAAYTSPTDSNGGALKKGKISVVSDGEGVLTVTVTGERYPDIEYKETVTLSDSAPFEADAKDTTVGFFVGTTGTNAYIDNIAFYDVEEFVDYEAGTILYKDVSNKLAVNTFENAVVRRISSASLANKTVDVVFNSENGDLTHAAVFDANGNWVNLVNQEMCTGITLPDENDYSDLVILAQAGDETNKTLAIKSDATHYYPRIKGVLGNDKFTWTSSDENIATVNAGAVSGHRAGSAAITASYKGASLTYDVTVKGEYDFALEEDKLDEYFASKKPVFDEINNAITEDDASKLKAVLTNTGDIKIESVLDINMDMLSQKDDTEIDLLVNNLINYEPFSFSSLEDYKAFEDAIKLELDVIKFEKVEDAAKLEELLANNNALLKLDAQNEYFVRFKQECILKLLNMEYDNYADLKQYFDQNIVMTSFEEMISYADIEKLCDDSEDVIKYDAQRYASEKGSDMFTALLNAKAAITDIAALKDFIDNYEKPVQTPSYSGGSSSGGGSSGGGSSIKFTPKYEANPEYVEEAEKEVQADISKENEAIYKDLEKGAWYEDYILKLAGKNIMNGNDGYIKPLDNITRAEFVKMLVLASNIAMSEEDACSFDDVKEDDWYYKYVASGYVNSIAIGSGNMFYPNSYVSREEIAVLIDRVINNLGLNVKSNSRDKLFNDDADISDWAYASVIRCSSYGIINGYSDNTFIPQGFATRAESAKMLSCLIDIINSAFDTVVEE